MKNLLSKLLVASLISCMATATVHASSPERQKKTKTGENDVATDVRGLGFYKDIFMNSGIRLTNRDSLYAEKGLGLQLEVFRTPDDSVKLDNPDEPLMRQTEIFSGCEEDLNGRLLYPDGEPRYRIIYNNGGGSIAHGVSLGESGRQNIRDFFHRGGSYVGTCAGSALVATGRDSAAVREDYYGIWPGVIHTTQLKKQPTTHMIEPGSPLLQYGDFGEDMIVDSIYHNLGNYADFSFPHPENTEVLARYRYHPEYGKKYAHMDNQPSAWAYRPDENSGRMVVIGSHPEKCEEAVHPEGYSLFCSMIKYAMDGNALPDIKAKLKKNRTYEANQETGYSDPAHIKIGDLQYHHYTVKVPARAKRMVVTLGGYEGSDNFDLSIYAKKACFAFKENAIASNTEKGVAKRLVIECPASGIWHISVRCENTVNSQLRSGIDLYGTQYVGGTEVLNGVPYNITVSFE